MKHNPFTFVYVCPSSYASYDDYRYFNHLWSSIGKPGVWNEFGLDLENCLKNVGFPPFLTMFNGFDADQLDFGLFLGVSYVQPMQFPS